MKDFKTLIDRLITNSVDFVIIGGFAAVLYGSTTVTQDLDLCFLFDQKNLEKLLKAILDLHPRHRMIGKTKVMDESIERLSSFKNLYLVTDAGYLDLIGEVKELGNFENVLKHSVEIDLFGHKCKVLDIDSLIKSKKGMARNKDKNVAVELELIKRRLQEKKY